MTIDLVEKDNGAAIIRVIGVGGGGGNAVNNMIQSGMTGVDFVVVNTDAQDLERSLAPRRFQLGGQLTKGLGAGADPEVGREAALEDRDRLAELVVGADMVFITAGMGGGTGTGAAPVIAQVAKEIGALTVACVTRPFHFESRRRRKQADEGVEALRSCVDTLITIPNQRLISMATERTTMSEAFGMADKVLYEAVKGVSDLIHAQGIAQPLEHVVAVHDQLDGCVRARRLHLATQLGVEPAALGSQVEQRRIGEEAGVYEHQKG